MEWDAEDEADAPHRKLLGRVAIQSIAMGQERRALRCFGVVRKKLWRLSGMAEDALVYVFSHGQFMQAVRSLVNNREKTTKKRCKMSGSAANPP